MVETACRWYTPRVTVDVGSMHQSTLSLCGEEHRASLAGSVTQRVIGLMWQPETGGPPPLLPIRSVMMKDVIDCQRAGRHTEG
jgi:hypothetical protein